MCNLNTLEDYYNYWDRFVLNWYMSHKPLPCWSENDINNSAQVSGDMSNKYLPEPWWGYNGSGDLSAVVLNTNPGKGGYSQKKGNLKNFTNYKQYVTKKVNRFYKNKERKIYNKDNDYVMSTSEWLLTQRAKPLFNAFNSIRNRTVKNILGVELIPWHSESSQLVETYIDKNLNVIYHKSIRFALLASEKISVPELRYVVFARVSKNRINRILKKYNGSNFKSDEIDTNIYKIIENNKTYYLIIANGFKNGLSKKEKLIKYVGKLPKRIP